MTDIQNTVTDPVKENLKGANAIPIPDKYKKEDGTLDVEKLLASHKELESFAGRKSAELVKARADLAAKAPVVDPEDAMIPEDKKELVDLSAAELGELVQTNVKLVLASKEKEEQDLNDASNYARNYFDSKKGVKELFGTLESFDAAISKAMEEEKLFERKGATFTEITKEAVRIATTNKFIEVSEKATTIPTPEEISEAEKAKRDYVPPTGSVPAVGNTKGKELFEKARETGDWTLYLMYKRAHPEEFKAEAYKKENII